MAEYIDRAAILKAYEEVQRRNGPWRFEALIESVPAADVAPVIHAHVVVNWLGDFHCSNCGESIDCTSNYCNWCGAILDEPEQKEE